MAKIIRTISVFLLLPVLIFALIGCVSSKKGTTIVSGKSNPVSIENIVKINDGKIRGEAIQGSYGKTVHQYFGVPYAEPPVGNLRWDYAQDKKPWDGVLDAVEFKPANYQFGKNLLPVFASMPQSEDCLYLNIITPAKTTEDKLPVMVWFHGGGLTMGGAIEPTYNMTRLSEQGAVVVLVNTRLGAFGLLVSDLISQSASGNKSGNYMISDMVMSLKWVKENIKAFGGDSGNVTIFGESGGGAKVNALIKSPKAEGLFSRAIIQSAPGVHAQYSGLAEAGNRLFEKLGVSTIDEARALPAKEIVAASNELNMEYQFAADGVFNIDSNESNDFSSGHLNKVPIIIGINKGEIHNLGKFHGFVDNLKTQTKHFSQNGENVFVYVFDQTPVGWRKIGCQAVHSMDLVYMFGDYDNIAHTLNGGPWAMNTIFFLEGKGYSMADMVDPELSDVDRYVSETMMEMWVSFAKNGDPSINGISWKPWNNKEDNYMYINEDGDTHIGLRSGLQNIN